MEGQHFLFYKPVYLKQIDKFKGAVMDKDQFNEEEGSLDSTQSHLGETQKKEGSLSGSAASSSEFYIISPKILKQDLPMYDILSVLGRGSSGIVYEAVHQTLNRKVAIKVLKNDYFENSGLLESLRKEAIILARIKHENVASVYDFVEVNRHYYLIMEHVEGTSLADLCQKGKMEEKAAIAVMKGLLEGIRFTHNKKILHLDLKPSNIILNSFGDPVIIDFGVSRFKIPGSEEKNTSAFGTPFYMSPEQYMRTLDRIDFRSDLYSLGVIFYQLLAGRLPFIGSNFKDIKMNVILQNPPRLSGKNSGISPDLEAIIFKLLDKNPVYRYPDAQTVLDEISRYQKGEPVKARKYRMMSLVWRWINRNPVISILFALLFITACIFLGYYSYKRYQETPQWKKVFTDNFNTEYKNRWLGYSGFTEGYVQPLTRKEFPRNFQSRMDVLSFRKNQDLMVASCNYYDEGGRLLFTLSANPESRSVFGFFINASLKDREYGYMIVFRQGEVSLIRDNILQTPLWNQSYDLQKDRVNRIQFEVVEGHIILWMNSRKILDFQDFIQIRPRKQYRFGFFARDCDLEIDNVEFFQLNTAMLITPLYIGNRFYQIGQYPEAVEEYSRVIKEYSGYSMAVDACYARGLAYIQLGRLGDAIRNFDSIIGESDAPVFKGKCLYQKGICFLEYGDIKKASACFQEAMEVYPVSSLYSNVVNTLVNFCRRKLKSRELTDLAMASSVYHYLMSLNVPSRIAFVDIPKSIILNYFDLEEYEKAEFHLREMIKDYSGRKDLVAFAYWKLGRVYMEMAGVGKGGKVDDKMVKKAIYSFKEVLIKCPEIRIYNYYALEEMAKASRAIGDFTQATEFEKAMSKYKEFSSEARRE